MNPKGLICFMSTLLLSTLVYAQNWDETSALDAYLFSQNPLTDEERMAPAAGCIPVYCLREIKIVTETFSQIEKSMPEGPSGKGNKWFAAITKVREDATKLSKSLSTEDCFTLAESLAAIISGFERRDSGFPLTPEYVACVLAVPKIQITMNYAVWRHLEDNRFSVAESKRRNLIIAALLADPTSIELPHPSYQLKLKDLFLIFPSDVIAFINNPTNREIIFILCEDSDLEGFGLYLSEDAPEVLKSAKSTSQNIEKLIKELNSAVERLNKDEFNDRDDYKALPGKLAAAERIHVYVTQKYLAIQLAENYGRRAEKWYTAHQEILAGFTQSYAENSPDGIFSIMPILWECGYEIGRYALADDEEVEGGGFDNADTIGWLNNNLMIRYLSELKGEIPADRMHQLVGGTQFRSGSCQEGDEPFRLSNIDLLILYPDVYLACIKSLKPEWSESLAASSVYTGYPDVKKYVSEISGDNEYWHNRFKTALTENRPKIETTFKAVEAWFREKHPSSFVEP